MTLVSSVYFFLLFLWYIFWLFFFFKQKTAYEMRISDWSSDVCSSDLYVRDPQVTVNFKSSDNLLATQSMLVTVDGQVNKAGAYPVVGRATLMRVVALAGGPNEFAKLEDVVVFRDVGGKSYVGIYNLEAIRRSEEHTSELQSLMSISSAVFCWK